MSFTADRLLLFGATGDLAQRMLLPSLCALHADKLVSEKLEIIGTARQPLDDAGFRNFAREALEKFMPADRRGGMATFLNRLSYQPLDATDTAGYAALASKVGTP
jgi:glucose-6-phosphate 1-dehydrogenase